MKTLGLIVNPVAGMGGKVGLKGSDGPEVLRMARERGATPEAPQRVSRALRAVAKTTESLQWITCPHEMGEDVCRAAGLAPKVLGSIRTGETTHEDTERAAEQLLEKQVDLLLFAGGDGTARDICRVVGSQLICLGIPAGVKIHSAVYAVTPRDAGEVAKMFLDGRLRSLREAEVMDIDEEAYRQGVVSARLYGYLRVPVESRYVQRMKAGGRVAEARALAGIADDVIDSMDESEVFVIGPGTTTRAIMEKLGLENTLLGVDVVCNRRLVAQDVPERQLTELIAGRRAKIVIAVIGGQGYILGRGNQQVSPTVVRQVGKEGILVVATKEKLASLGGRPLLVDTGDEALNEELSGYVRVTTGYEDYVIYKVGHHSATSPRAASAADLNQEGPLVDLGSSAKMTGGLSRRARH